MRQVKRAFTLIELLVVIGIIAILAGLLIPTVAYMRESGYATNTSAEIAALQASITAYHGTFRAYPGPISEETIAAVPGAPGLPSGLSGRPTATENLFLGLAGGLVPDSGGNPVLDANAFGRGPYNFASGKQLQPFYSEWAADITYPGSDYSKTYHYVDRSRIAAIDSNVPEFLDRFPDPMPLLYLRSHQGMPGVCGSRTQGLQVQYSTEAVSGYTTPGLGRLGIEGGKATTRHGLSLQQTCPDSMTMLQYLIDPSNPGQNPTEQQGNARVKDSYIIISAGRDRVYGTEDDITTFGEVVP